MIRKLTWAVLATVWLLLLPEATWGTFSIVAVDTATGAIGGAGASCIDNAEIINDTIEGIGAVHTQAYWLSQNQENAHNLLLQGLTPDSIIGWLVANDYAGRPNYRQYGVVTLAGSGSSAAHTGANCDIWRGHRIGPTYAIQGNILLGPEIVDSMETAYLTTNGPLEDKLMAALEAAKVPGADTRCLPSGKSAISAFIKVVRIGDGGSPYLYEVVTTTSGSTDPIDVLREQYDAWLAGKWADPDSSLVAVTREVLLGDGADTAVITVTPLNHLGAPPTDGASVSMSNSGPGTLSPVIDNGDGTFAAVLTAPVEQGEDTVFATVDASGQQTELSTRPVIVYFTCGNVDGSGDGVDVGDLTYLVAYLFQSGPPPPLLDAANVDGSSSIDVGDLTYLVAYLFQGGPAPTCAPVL